MITPDHTEPLARACLEDAPGTVFDRWRARCATGLLATLLGNGRDITIIVGRRTDRKLKERA